MINFSQILPVLQSTELFHGLSEGEIKDLLDCFSPTVHRFSAGEIILLSGYEGVDAGVVLRGRVEAVKTTPGGRDITMSVTGIGDVFGDMLASAGRKSPVTITARSDCEILFIPHEKLLCPCALSHPAHTRLLQNLVVEISEKYFSLSDRIDILIERSLRRRIVLYLLSEAEKAGSDHITISLTREGLARYLNCDRTALSRELSRLRDEGYLSFQKNQFHLKGLQKLL